MQLSAVARPHFVPTKSTRCLGLLSGCAPEMQLTGAKGVPVTDLVAIRIVELALTGEFDPDKLTDTVLAEFDG
jgi:hypothetical protein